MTVNINIQEAEVAFSELLNRVSRGEEITITQNGVAIARLVPVNQNPPKRIPGSAKGLITIAPDFDAPLPDDIAVPIQMRYNITSRDVRARHCRAPTGVPHVNENRYILASFEG